MRGMFSPADEHGSQNAYVCHIQIRATVGLNAIIQDPSTYFSSYLPCSWHVGIHSARFIGSAKTDSLPCQEPGHGSIFLSNPSPSPTWAIFSRCFFLSFLNQNTGYAKTRATPCPVVCFVRALMWPRVKIQIVPPVNIPIQPLK